MSSTCALEVRDLCKSYPGVVALSEVSLKIQPGEVRALLGKNGAGKSTLVKILSGAESPDRGEVRIGGEVVSFRNTADARHGGIGTVFQELSLVPHLSVAENIMLGRWSDAGGARAGLFDPKAIRAKARQALEPLDVDLDVTLRVSRLSVAQQQVVEIAKALSYDPKVLILDEPTSSLPITEVEVLLALVRRLADRGVAVIYVSHRMAEIPKVADSVTVMRDGRLIATKPIAEAGTEEIIDLMTGGEWSQPEQVTPRRLNGEVVLKVNDLHTRRLQSVSFELKRGEILGLAGILGSGRSSLLRSLYGDERVISGSAHLRGRSIVGMSPKQLSRIGVGFTPEERKREGLALDLAIEDNLTLASLAKYRVGPFLSRSKARAASVDMIDRFAIKTPSPGTKIGLLSGGNQQKAILGRWVLAGADLLLLDEPTRGVDIHAKDQIYDILREMAEKGASIVVASSELEELFLFCDRLLVLNGGHVVADQSISEADPETVMAMTMEGTV